ncbi:DNA polymerase III subunit gamma/tau [Shewanella acanthi]|uniref:DNA polymerase III subunit gamma/tau n=1 Tax=Shewanella acanthi TaxID=2864212 RepID=UPI001C65F3A8|nr:DNA polymerase III subunit gamma/tau [Shewanella acanthi]QYJ77541.1 DNA polymerase III subunit gamma/tau [Shewanella acanthi]
MSYQVLARKWRPATFEQMVGQSHVLHALTNALSQQRLHHAYLFTGTRGVGKTSLARLFAKGLNCEKGVTASPCGVCGSCVEIAQGRFVDLIEVDAASRTKVDDTRELLDNVQYRPTRGRFKVYLIDEVHMLSRSSFNALLKTLEEPPEHVKFLLATTDPQKLPVTVLSRCLQFNLKSLTQQEIGNQLEHILSQEQLPFEQEALNLLSKAANGSMRDALSLTDQAIAFGGGTVMLNQVQSMLGSIDEQHVLGLLKALTDADIAVLMQTCSQVLAYGADAQEVLRSLLELLHQITLTQFAPAAAQQSLYSTQIQAFAEQLMPEQVQLYYQILLTGRKDLAYAPDPKSGLEMALLRAVAFVPEKSVQRWQVENVANVSLPAAASAEEQASQTNRQHYTQSKSEIISSTGAKPNSLEKKTLEPRESLSETAQTPDNLVANPQANMDHGNGAKHGSEPTNGSERSGAALSEAVAVELTSVAPSLHQSEAADDLVDDEALSASLQTEQQIILSQAQSQGFGATASSSTPSSVDAFSDGVDSATDTQSAIEAEFYLSEAPLEAYQNDYAEGEFDYDYVQSNGYSPSDEYVQSQDLQADVSNSADSAGAVTGNSIAEASVTDYLQNGNPVSGGLAKDNSQSAITASQNINSSGFALDDDDILSQVLAARELLLTDLDALSTKDGEEKKRSIDVKVKPQFQSESQPKSMNRPKAESHSMSESTVEMPAQVSGLSDIDFDDDFGLDVDADFAPESHSENVSFATETTMEAATSAIDTTANRGIHPEHKLDPNDRPPWEEPLAPILSVEQGSATHNLAGEAAIQPMADSTEANLSDVNGQEQQPAVVPSTEAKAVIEGTEIEAINAKKVDTSIEILAASHNLESKPQNQNEGSAVASNVIPLHSTSRETSMSNATAISLAVPITGHPLDLHWYKLMASLEIGGRVRQLAVNSICQALENPLPLLLKPDQKHLAAHIAIEQLEQALTDALGSPRQVLVSVGSDNSRETPLDMRKRFHQELLQQAQKSLMTDDNVQWLIKRFGAELNNDTIQYPQELLTQRSSLIESLPEAGTQLG